MPLTQVHQSLPMEEEFPVDLKHVQGRVPKDRCSHNTLRLKQDIHYEHRPQERCLLIMCGSCFKDALVSVHRMRGLVASPGWIWPWARAVFWAARLTAGLPTGPAPTQAGGAVVFAQPHLQWSRRSLFTFCTD